MTLQTLTLGMLVVSFVIGILHYRFVMRPYTAPLPQPKEVYSVAFGAGAFLVYIGVLALLRLDGLI